MDAEVERTEINKSEGSSMDQRIKDSLVFLTSHTVATTVVAEKGDVFARCIGEELTTEVEIGCARIGQLRKDSISENLQVATSPAITCVS